MNEMVERVAKALGWGGEESSRQAFNDAARAAIEAMREPTDAMLDAGADNMHEGVIYSLEPGEGVDGYDSSPVWEAMIDAALTPPEPPSSPSQP